MFTWLRNKVAASILAGVNDAMERLGGGDDDEAPAVALLELRLKKVEVAETGEKAKGRAKG